MGWHPYAICVHESVEQTVVTSNVRDPELMNNTRSSFRSNFIIFDGRSVHIDVNHVKLSGKCVQDGWQTCVCVESRSVFGLSLLICLPMCVRARLYAFLY